MVVLNEIANNLLLEQDSKLEVIRKSIGERIPMSIYYRGPSKEVREGQRIDIEPVVMGKHIKSGNLVIWAYVFKGISKKGLPDWKMFRVDRIVSAKLNFNVGKFKLELLPGYKKGKAPSMMKSLSSVEIFSPYWFEDDERFMAQPKPITKTPIEKSLPPETKPMVKVPIEKPEMSSKQILPKIYNDLKGKSTDINGQRFVSLNDYERALKDLYNSKESEFKIYQRAISGNERPGEGTRKRFTDTSKKEIDGLLSKDNIQVSDNPEQLNEAYRIQKRFRRLINW